MLPGMELMGCTGLAVPAEVMHHVVRVESSFNPYAIGVVGGRLARQPRSLAEALSTARMLEREGYDFSLGLAQVNRRNLSSQGLDSFERAFDACPNLRAGARILADCYRRAEQDWGKAFSCYYSGNFDTGFRHGYVQKVFASWQASAGAPGTTRDLVTRRARNVAAAGWGADPASPAWRRVQEAASTGTVAGRVPGLVEPAPAHAAVPMQAAMPETQATGQVAAVAMGDDGAGRPVVVQPMTVVAPSTASMAGPAEANGPPAAPPRDAAFVF